MEQKAENPAVLAEQVMIAKNVYYTEDDLQRIMIMDGTTGECYGLDSSAALIWKVLAQSQRMDCAIDALITTYGIECVRARDDVLAFVEDLAANGLVEKVNKGENNVE